MFMRHKKVNWKGGEVTKRGKRGSETEVERG